MVYLQQLVKRMIFLILAVFFIPVKFFIRERNSVILQAASREVYCDNTKYLYELLSEKKSVDAYWVTDNSEIIQYITGKGWKYITRRNPIKMIRVALRARVVIDNGSGYFNPFNLTNSKSTVKISLLHGSGPKATISRSNDIMTAVQQILDMNKFDYVNFTSEYSVESLAKKTYFLPNKKIVKFGYPRCDLFFNTKRVEEIYQNKKIAKTLNVLSGEKNKLILYTPTWRPYEYTFPLSEMLDFSFGDFNKWLQLNNLVFFYTVHTALLPKDIPDDLERIVFINTNVHPLFDVNKFMLEVDILVNDYSTTSTDFSILNRPQIFYMPDYDFYNSEKCFIEPYREIMPGKEVFNYDEFKRTLLDASLNSKSYVDKYSATTKELQDKYYNICFKNSTSELSEFVQRFL